MAELTAPQQNRLLAGLSNLLRRVEQDSGPEFLPRGLDVMGLVRQLALPSAETVEKMSYGDPLFRMPTQSNIPITTDRGYLAEVLGLAPPASAASRATTRLSNEAADALVRQITGRSDATAMRALEEIGQMSPVPQVMSGSRDLIRSSADDLAGELNSLGFQAKVQHSGSRAGPSSYVEIYDPQTGRFFTKPIRFSGHGKGPFEAAGVIDVQDPSTDIPNIVQEALQMREMGPSTVFQKQAIADELIAGGMKPKQAYAEAEQRVAGLLEPQAVQNPLYQLTKEEFLGNPKIISPKSSQDLKPRTLTTNVDVTPEPFMGGKYDVKMSEDGAAVLDGDKVIASYNFGKTLVVDPKYRKQGIAEELVYQWRSRYPGVAQADTRTKASQRVQEKVWDRIQNEKFVAESNM